MITVAQIQKLFCISSDLSPHHLHYRVATRPGSECHMSRIPKLRKTWIAAEADINDVSGLQVSRVS